MYLWINYALFEELQAGDADRTREVYKYVRAAWVERKGGGRGGKGGG